MTTAAASWLREGLTALIEALTEKDAERAAALMAEVQPRLLAARPAELTDEVVALARRGEALAAAFMDRLQAELGSSASSVRAGRAYRGG